MIRSSRSQVPWLTVLQLELSVVSAQSRFRKIPTPSQVSCDLFVEELFSARVPKSSAEVRSVYIHDIKGGESVGQQEQQGDKRDDEEGDEVKGEVEEIRRNAHYMHG